jgi:hypothetical protein
MGNESTPPWFRESPVEYPEFYTASNGAPDAVVDHEGYLVVHANAFGPDEARALAEWILANFPHARSATTEGSAS